MGTRNSIILGSLGQGKQYISIRHAISFSAI